jgi:hypothetical protein
MTFLLLQKLTFWRLGNHIRQPRKKIFKIKLFLLHLPILEFWLLESKQLVLVIGIERYLVKLHLG